VTKDIFTPPVCIDCGGAHGLHVRRWTDQPHLQNGDDRSSSNSAKRVLMITGLEKQKSLPEDPYWDTIENRCSAQDGDSWRIRQPISHPIVYTSPHIGQST